MRRYAGQWQGDKEHGQGVYTFADGNEYDGRYAHGQRNGYGVYRKTDGSRYEGVLESLIPLSSPPPPPPPPFFKGRYIQLW